MFCNQSIILEPYFHHSYPSLLCTGYYLAFFEFFQALLLNVWKLFFKLRYCYRLNFTYIIYIIKVWIFSIRINQVSRINIINCNSFSCIKASFSTAIPNTVKSIFNLLLVRSNLFWASTDAIASSSAISTDCL